jgi:hypothetical protein
MGQVAHGGSDLSVGVSQAQHHGGVLSHILGRDQSSPELIEEVRLPSCSGSRRNPAKLSGAKDRMAHLR